MTTNYVRGASASCAASRGDIESLLAGAGAGQIRFVSEAGRTAISFTAGRRRFRIVLELPTGTGQGAEDLRHERETRRRWHALALLFRAKVNAVESGVTSFEEEFLAYMLTPAGQSVYQKTRAMIAQSYRGREL